MRWSQPLSSLNLYVFTFSKSFCFASTYKVDEANVDTSNFVESFGQ